jgi:hypothetical protein
MISLDDHYSLRHENFDALKLQSATYDHRWFSFHALGYP